MPTTAEILNEWGSELGFVPPARESYVCSYCLGPVKQGYDHCYGCNELFNPFGPPTMLRKSVVPMTSVLNPSPWYGALAAYKGFAPRRGLVLASVAHHFLATFAPQIQGMLGGDPTAIAIVPSKRGITYDDQPLRKALGAAPPIETRLRCALTHVPGETIPRRGYNAGAFAPGPYDVSAGRIVLIEDTWVTGATAVSAAGALLEHGAESVIICPIARVLTDSYWEPDHPYRHAMTRRYDPHDVTRWPR